MSVHDTIFVDVNMDTYMVHPDEMIMSTWGKSTCHDIKRKLTLRKLIFLT